MQRKSNKTKYMKRLILNALAVICMGINCNAQDKHTIIVNGEKLEGKNVVSITFDGDDANLLLSDNSTLNINMEKVEILFNANSTGIEELRTSVFNYNGIVDDYLVIGGITPFTAIAIYDSTGRLRTRVNADSGATSVYVGNLGKGIYTAKAGKHVIKFAKK